MKKCPYCAESIQEEAIKCKHCGAFLSQSASGHDAAVHAGSGGVRLVTWGYEYKSALAIFGLPLVHIVIGRFHPARGVFAFGNIAIGVVAFGGAAFGGLTFGGFSLGLIAIGGFAIGGVVLGGMAFGGLLALGGIAVSLGYAVGGLAIAPCAFGGGSRLSDVACFRPLLDIVANWGFSIAGVK